MHSAQHFPAPDPHPEKRRTGKQATCVHASSPRIPAMQLSHKPCSRIHMKRFIIYARYRCVIRSGSPVILPQLFNFFIFYCILSSRAKHNTSPPPIWPFLKYTTFLSNSEKINICRTPVLCSIPISFTAGPDSRQPTGAALQRCPVSVPTSFAGCPVCQKMLWRALLGPERENRSPFPATFESSAVSHKLLHHSSFIRTGLGGGTHTHSEGSQRAEDHRGTAHMALRTFPLTRATTWRKQNLTEGLQKPAASLGNFPKTSQLPRRIEAQTSNIRLPSAFMFPEIQLLELCAHLILNA